MPQHFPDPVPSLSNLWRIVTEFRPEIYHPKWCSIGGAGDVKESAMRRRIRFLAPTMLFTLPATLALAGLPDGSVSAADHCIAAPNSHPASGGHWYYRLDRAKHRRCWYLASQGQAVRRAIWRHPPATASAAARPSGIAGDGAPRIAKPFVQTEVAAAEASQAGQEAVQGAMHDMTPAIPFATRWPTQLRQDETNARAIATMDAASAISEREVPGRAAQQPAMALALADAAPAMMQVPATIAAGRAMTVPAENTSPRGLVLAACALAIIGVLGPPTFKLATGRRRRLIDRDDAAAHERASTLTAQRSRDVTYGPVERIDLHRDEEGALRQLLRAWQCSGAAA
jgi:hypothetical protein